MKEQKFEVKGDFRMGDEWRPFTKVIEAPSEAQAKERTYAVFGSKHRVKRSYITIHSITLLSGD
ncbi:MAG: 50S ribosomal protein L18Ae [Methanolinea sp.]|nr:50S ribosomal protein L18Ae [Methanolinea sp.]